MGVLSLFVSIRLASGLLLFLRGGTFVPLLLLLFLRGRGRYTAPVRQRQLRRLQHVFFPNIQPSGQCRECAGRPLQSQLTTMPGAMRFSGKLRHPFQQKPGDTDLCDEPLRLPDADGKRGLPFRVLKEKSLRISVKPLAEPQDLQPFFHVAGRGYRNRQPEAIQKLGPKLSLFRVHRTDKHETRRMFCGDAFPPDPVHALGAGFEDDVRHMIRKQIDFIYIQDTTVRGCEQSGLKDTHTLAERRFHVQASGYPVFAGGQGNIRQLGRKGH